MGFPGSLPEFPDPFPEFPDPSPNSRSPPQNLPGPLLPPLPGCSPRSWEEFWGFPNPFGIPGTPPQNPRASPFPHSRNSRNSRDLSPSRDSLREIPNPFFLWGGPTFQPRPHPGIFGSFPAPPSAPNPGILGFLPCKSRESLPAPKNPNLPPARRSLSQNPDFFGNNEPLELLQKGAAVPEFSSWDLRSFSRFFPPFSRFFQPGLGRGWRLPKNPAPRLPGAPNPGKRGSGAAIPNDPGFLGDLGSSGTFPGIPAAFPGFPRIWG